MSVNTNREATLVPFPVSPQMLARPSGIWYGFGDTSAGDGSGGILSLTIRRSDLADTRRRWAAWSIEHAFYRSAINGGHHYTGIWDPTGFMQQWAAFTLEFGAAQIAGSDTYYRSTFPGSQVVMPSYTLYCACAGANNAGTVATAGAWGYLWDHRAFDQPGGPSRPFSSSAGLSVAASGLTP